MGNDGLLILNFSHPLTSEQLAQIEGMTEQKVEDVIEAKMQFDDEEPFAPQLVELADSIGLTSEEWQTLPLLINPPAFSIIAVTLLAELHGRMGYFPACLRLRPIEGSTPRRFEVAEVVNLQAVRDRARKKR